LFPPSFCGVDPCGGGASFPRLVTVRHVVGDPANGLRGLSTSLTCAVHQLSATFCLLPPLSGPVGTLCCTIRAFDAEHDMFFSVPFGYPLSPCLRSRPSKAQGGAVRHFPPSATTSRPCCRSLRPLTPGFPYVFGPVRQAFLPRSRRSAFFSSQPRLLLDRFPIKKDVTQPGEHPDPRKGRSESPVDGRHVLL